MEQNYIMNIIDNLNLTDNIKLEDIPEIDLYMDQVIQLFERKYGCSLRNDEEKVLTKTMINNYAKDDLFMPVRNKRYSKDNLILISMIYQMKGALSIKDIKASLETMVRKSMEGHTADLRNFYACYLDLLNSKINDFKNNVDKDIEHINTICKELKFNDEYEEKLFMILNLVTMSNAYRRLAEKIIDDL
ncbi:protein of unknown function [Hathewaya proteolytica DSM 3090]|uniref:DUF1836 domain-containing protein n=1 Tax=Hathewaya proteolytica DSM 3090 TaxID=1121331 RepID=A0A1M6MGF7_9CLOT|nr:DUF1836 domain-containing protein [Hathewaya proteolytica]SHJ82545.1 protein of unknown function [Hathewaya proteolytica DSM 3090]